MKMQDTSHKAGDYARPNLNWQCGREACCQMGPTVNGRCSDPEQKCIPQRSVKSKKRIATIWLFSVLIGVMTVFLSASVVLNRVSPGPVSMSHAEVTSCETCHSAAGNSISQWVEQAATRIIGLSSSNQHGDDEQCLSCHTLGENALLAHSTSPDSFNSSTDAESLSKLASHGWQASIASTLHNLQRSSTDEINCSTCHQEHKGERDPRVNFDSQKCHTCHEVKFGELEVGHPEYTLFPYSRPTNINYDHSNHRGKYFSDENYADNAPQTCQGCHVTDQTGEWMLLYSFEETCSGCHLDDVLGMDRTTAKGIPVFTIPKLDIETLADAGFNIGEWPSSSEGDLTPFMRALLPTSFRQSSLLKSKSLTLGDLSKANKEQLETAALLAWEIKRLFYELVLGGTAVFDHRLSNALGGVIDQSTMNRLISALPKDTLLNNQKELFPNLMEELTDYRSGRIKFKLSKQALTPDAQALNPDVSLGLVESAEHLGVTNQSEPAETKKVSKSMSIDMPDEEWAVSGGWYREGNKILYRPIDHADLFFKTWLDLSATQLDTLDSSLFESLTADKSVGNCTKCHTVQTNMATDETEPSASTKQAKMPDYKMNWRSFHPSDVVIDFNRFSHDAHFNKDCVSCHEVNSEPSVDRKERNLPPALGVSITGFLNMEKTTCTECHQEGRAPDTCLTCHNYHAEPHRKRVDDMPDDMPIREK